MLLLWSLIYFKIRDFISRLDLAFLYCHLALGHVHSSTVKSTSSNNEPIHMEVSYEKTVMKTVAVYLKVEEKTNSFTIQMLFSMASLTACCKCNFFSLTWCNPRKLHSEQRSIVLLHWVMESRVVKVGGESGCGRHRYRHPTKTDVWTIILSLGAYPTSYSKQGQLWGQSRLLRALPSHILETPQDWRLHNPSVSNMSLLNTKELC